MTVVFLAKEETKIDRGVNLTPDEILQFALDNGMLSMSSVQEQMNMKKREEYLSMHPYSIFQAKDGRWRTTLPDKTRKDGRRAVAKSSREQAEEEVIKYYSSIKELPEHKPTLRDIYPKWIKYKLIHTDATSYIKRLMVDWNRFYKDDKITDIPIEDLTYLALDEWAHKLVKDNQLKKKQYYNATAIIRQCLDYACEPEVGIINSNPFARVRIKSNLFAVTSKPKDNSQVFLIDEQRMVRDECKKRFENRNWCMTPLIVLLNFQLGLRIGEICALKWDDIHGNYVHVQRMESVKYDLDDNGELVPLGYEIVNHTKSSAGDREVFLNSEARELLKKIRIVSMKQGYYDENFIFIASRQRTRGTSRTLTKYLEDLCARLKIGQKSNHKIRKTYISSLIENGVNINTVRLQAGHEDERTTLNNYCFDTNTDEAKERMLEEARNRQVAM